MKVLRTKFLGCMFGVVGLIFVGVVVYDYFAGTHTEHYVETQGTVVETRIEQDQFREKSPRYYGKIKYAYTVNGRQFTSERFSFPNPSSDELSKIKKFTAEYPSGKLIDVYYDPKDPSSATLAKGVHSDLFFVPLGMAIMMFFEALFFYFVAGRFPQAKDKYWYFFEKAPAETISKG